MMPILAYRIWNVDTQGNLVGLYGKEWKDNNFMAECELHEGYVPLKNCTCGIYSVKTLEKALFMYHDSKPNIKDLWASINLAITILRGTFSLLGKGETGRDFYKYMWMGVCWPEFKRQVAKFYSNPDTVIGIVALSGRNLVYEDVIRSQRVKIIALMSNYVNPETKQRLSYKYGVPFYNSLEKAQAYAREMGEPTT